MTAAALREGNQNRFALKRTQSIVGQLLRSQERFQRPSTSDVAHNSLGSSTDLVGSRSPWNRLELASLAFYLRTATPGFRLSALPSIEPPNAWNQGFAAEETDWPVPESFPSFKLNNGPSSAKVLLKPPQASQDSMSGLLGQARTTERTTVPGTSVLAPSGRLKPGLQVSSTSQLQDATLQCPTVEDYSDHASVASLCLLPARSFKACWCGPRAVWPAELKIWASYAGCKSHIEEPIGCPKSWVLRGERTSATGAQSSTPPRIRSTEQAALFL